MPSLLEFALKNPGLIFTPSMGGLVAVLVVRVKSRYLNEGVFFRRSSAPWEDAASTTSSDINRYICDETNFCHLPKRRRARMPVICRGRNSTSVSLLQVFSRPRREKRRRRLVPTATPGARDFAALVGEITLRRLRRPGWRCKQVFWNQDPMCLCQAIP